MKTVTSNHCGGVAAREPLAVVIEFEPGKCDRSQRTLWATGAEALPAKEIGSG